MVEIHPARLEDLAQAQQLWARVFGDDAAFQRDFYALTGALEYIKNPVNAITSVEQVFMNKEECDGLIELMFSNIVGNSKKKNDTYLRYIRNSIGLDWANISPVSNEKTPRGELWLCSKGEAEKMLKKIRAAAKKKNKKENRDA